MYCICSGNNWGRCSDGVSRVGCGPQETFRGCSDIAIGSSTPPRTNATISPDQYPRKNTPSPRWPTVSYPKKINTSPYWPKTHKTTTYRPQSKSSGKGLNKSKNTTPQQKRTTPPPRQPGLEKEDGLPMIPSETKMTGHYPEPTTRRPHTRTQGPSEGKQTTPRTRFSPKTVRPYWMTSTTPQSTRTSSKASRQPTSNDRTTKVPKITDNEIPRDKSSSGNSNKKKRCVPVGNYAESKKMFEWCKLNCLHEPYYCPKSHCSCE